MARELKAKTPQSSSAPKADRLTVTLPSIKPHAAVLALITPDPGRKLMDVTEALVAEVTPCVLADPHLRHMLLRLKNLVIEGEGWAAIAERKLVNGHIGMIVTDYLHRKKIRRADVHVRHDVGPSVTRVFISLSYGRSEATRTLEIPNQ